MANQVFYEVRPRSANPSNSGLTELNAATAVDKGFMSHNDWLAHCARYGYAQKVITREHVQTLLDYGCGSLQLPYYLWRNRQPPIGAYWGVDLRAQENWLDKVGWATNMNLVRADLVLDYPEEEIPEFPTAYDLVVCTEVLEHVSREMAPELIRRLFEYTRPGGSCLLSSPNAGVSDSTAENHIGPEGSREWTYFEKLKMCEDAGFKLLEAYGTFGGARRFEADDRFDHDNLVLMRAKAFLPHGWYTTLVAAAMPDIANNALFHLRRPANG